MRCSPPQAAHLLCHNPLLSTDSALLPRLLTRRVFCTPSLRYKTEPFWLRVVQLEMMLYQQTQRNDTRLQAKAFLPPEIWCRRVGVTPRPFLMTGRFLSQGV